MAQNLSPFLLIRVMTFNKTKDEELVDPLTQLHRLIDNARRDHNVTTTYVPQILSHLKNSVEVLRRYRDQLIGIGIDVATLINNVTDLFIRMRWQLTNSCTVFKMVIQWLALVAARTLVKVTN
jgi:hypothetical protein